MDLELYANKFYLMLGNW